MTEPAKTETTNAEPSYTFVSVSTAKAGRLDDLVELARRPSELMEGKVPGMLARQVSVDRERNAVVVWLTFSARSDLYDYLATEQGRSGHGEDHDMTDIIATFEMYDLTPVSGRLTPVAG
jgi:hypothetical protein